MKVNSQAYESAYVIATCKPDEVLINHLYLFGTGKWLLKFAAFVESTGYFVILVRFNGMMVLPGPSASDPNIDYIIKCGGR